MHAKQSPCPSHAGCSGLDGFQAWCITIERGNLLILQISRSCVLNMVDLRSRESFQDVRQTVFMRFKKLYVQKGRYLHDCLRRLCSYSFSPILIGRKGDELVFA